MTHFWLTDPITGRQYINNPGNPNHGSCSPDGVTWYRPLNNEHLSRREAHMKKIMKQIERERLAALQDGTLANHIGNMETPEAAAERERERERREQNLKAMKELKKIVDRKTIGEHLMDVLGCALFACFMAAFALLTVACIDAIIKIVGAW